MGGVAGLLSGDTFVAAEALGIDVLDHGRLPRFVGHGGEPTPPLLNDV